MGAILGLILLYFILKLLSSGSRSGRGGRRNRKGYRYTPPKEKKASRFSKSLHCPKCRSFNVQVVGSTRKGFSIGKAVGGYALTGGLGTLAGFSGKNNKKPKFHCMSCGNVFKYKI